MSTSYHEELPITRHASFMIQILPLEVWETIMMVIATLFLVWVGINIQQFDSSDTLPAQLDSLWQLCGILWLLIILETLLGFAIMRPYHRKTALQTGMICILPPLRIIHSTWRNPDQIWLLSWGWQKCDKRLFERLERLFAIPMVFVTALILPSLIIQIFFKDHLTVNVNLQTAMNMTMAFIWFAFAFEFIIMVAVSENKLNYCLQHWINLVIIILPFAAFLRYLQVFQILKITHIGSILQAYRLRSLTVRIQRIAVLLNLIDRIFSRTPEKYLQHLRHQALQKEQELEKLRDKISMLEKQLSDNAKNDSGCMETSSSVS